MAISPHVARLRSLVGTQLLQLPGVTVLPVDDSGRLLLVRHADTGQWGALGGAIEVDERPEDAAVRETVEEIGLRPTITRLVGAFSGPEYRVEYSNGDKASYVVVAYEARIDDGEPVPDGDEVVGWSWFRPDSIPALEVNGLVRALPPDAGYVPATGPRE